MNTNQPIGKIFQRRFQNPVAGKLTQWLYLGERDGRVELVDSANPLDGDRYVCTPAQFKLAFEPVLDDSVKLNSSFESALFSEVL
jgi:hypothetical protein